MSTAGRRTAAPGGGSSRRSRWEEPSVPPSGLPGAALAALIAFLVDGIVLSVPKEQLLA